MNPQRDPRSLLRALFQAAVARVAGDAVVRRAVAWEEGRLVIGGRPVPDRARLFVLAAGKAAPAMAEAFDALAGDQIAAGLVVTKDGHGLLDRRGRQDRRGRPDRPLARFALREAGHPVPDARSEAAGAEALRLAASTRPDDVLVVLLSGGASALLSAPLPGVSGADLAATTRALLASGAAIDELNAVRKHLTAVSGGRLARCARARRIEVLAISDVAGDDPAVIGSGPCAPDPTRFRDALAVLARCADVPQAVRAHLEAGAAGAREESPAPGDPACGRARHHVLVANRDALDAAGAAARERGVAALRLDGELSGEARTAGRRLAALALALARGPERVLLAGGETTVTLRGPGRGGRSQELALAAACELAGSRGVTLLAAGSDGSDGPTDAAGAFVDGATLARGRERGVDAEACLARNDSHTFFSGEGGLFVTGPTGTNVRDLVLVHVV